MTSAEIVKALRCCENGNCTGCNLRSDKQRCQERLLGFAADLIERLEKEKAMASFSGEAKQIVQCKDCEYSTLPSELTQRYGKPGTLTCHNRYAPCNRRNVGKNDFCSYGKRRGNGRNSGD